jgi:biopolymer transport protein ExbD
LPLAEPLIVRIEFAGYGLQPNVRLNSQLVPCEQFASALQKSLKLRADWVVHIEADRDVNWQYVIDLMDAIRGDHAKVVLLTTPIGHER